MIVQENHLLQLSLNNEKNLRTRINRAFERHQGSI